MIVTSDTRAATPSVQISMGSLWRATTNRLVGVVTEAGFNEADSTSLSALCIPGSGARSALENLMDSALRIIPSDGWLNRVVVRGFFSG